MKDRVLAYTVSYGDRSFLEQTIPDFRQTAGMWFDWALFLGNPSKRLEKTGRDFLTDSEGMGVQYLKVWAENRGQHHATHAALELAKEKGYKWLLRIDDDVRAKTKKWLHKMVKRAHEIKELTDDKAFRHVFCPTITRLRNPVPAEGVMENGQPYDIEVVPLHGGALRLHSVEALEGYKAPLYAPAGRGDPQSIATHLKNLGGYFLRFKDIRVVHDTKRIETQDNEEQTLIRKMSHYWPFLESEEV